MKAVTVANKLTEAGIKYRTLSIDPLAGDMVFIIDPVEYYQEAISIYCIAGRVTCEIGKTKATFGYAVKAARKMGASNE